METNKQKGNLTFDEHLWEALDEICLYEKEIKDHNDIILKELSIHYGERINKDFEILIDGTTSVGKIEIVKEPDGDNQEEDCKIIKEIYIRQWSNGTEGDSFYGFIYGKLEENKWLKIPYSC